MPRDPSTTKAAVATRIVDVGGDGGAEQAAYAAGLGYDHLTSRAAFPDPVGGPARLADLDRLAPHGGLAVHGDMGPRIVHEGMARSEPAP
ncbi:hypothetical protein [Streptomyces sp. NPDC056144]|uniref:hypothetical protein n=1 Tax=unclassified Streptomyces TaxID=2593676 RepID=UPI0035E061F2